MAQYLRRLSSSDRKKKATAEIKSFSFNEAGKLKRNMLWFKTAECETDHFVPNK